MIEPQRSQTGANEGTSGTWLRTLLIILLVSFLISLVGSVLWLVLTPLKGIILLFIIAALIAYLLDPPVSYMENLGISRALSIVFLYIVSFSFLYGIGSALSSPVFNEIENLLMSIESEKVNTAAREVKKFVMSNFPMISEEQIDRSIQELLSSFQDLVLNATRGILTFAQGMFSFVIQLFMVPLIAFFLLKDGPALKKGLLTFVPNKFFEMSLHLFYKTDQQIGRYIRGQIVDNLILALFYSVGFYFLGIPYFIVFGAFSGVANVVPYIGPVIGIIPPFILSIIETGSLETLPIIILLFIVIQIIDVTLIQPSVVAKSVDLHPLIVIFAVFAGGTLLGITGMLFAVLLAGIIKVIITEISWCYRNFHIQRYLR